MSFPKFVLVCFQRAFTGARKVESLINFTVVLGGLLLGAALSYRGDLYPKFAGPAVIGLFILGGLLFQGYRMYREEHDQREQLEEDRKPKLSFAGVGERTDNIYRIKVRNTADVSVIFRTHLVSISPGINVSTPLVLMPTHRDGYDTAEVAPHGECTVDVFVDHQGILRLRAANGRSYEFTKGRGYELILSLTPVDSPGLPVCRRFYITPQPPHLGTGQILNDGGEYTPPKTSSQS